MRLVNYQEIMKEKLARQESIPELEYHASGHCLHIGKISPGCRKCFTGEQGSGIQIGTQCMFNCPMCYYDPKRPEQSQSKIHSMLADYFYQSFNKDWKPTIFSYQSAGETLLYLDELEKFAAILRKVKEQTGINHYYFLYTNGVLCNKENLERLKAMGVHEIRFHVSASNFSTEVYHNMELAAKMGFFITVEEPSWPHHRAKLFEMLPILNDVGGKHLDMVEVQISKWNRPAIERAYPGDMARCYKDYFYHLYDEGLVYDIMEEVIAKGYKFSVLDCNSAVERCRHNKDQEVLFDPKSVEGMCVDWEYDLRRVK